MWARSKINYHLCQNVSELKKVFISTPNRNYPFDFHTKLPLIHLLPKNIHRKILKIGLSFFSKEENLNLMAEKDLINICTKLKLKITILLNINFVFYIKLDIDNK